MTERKTDLVFPLLPNGDTDTPSSTMPLGLNLFDLNELSSALQSHHDEIARIDVRPVGALAAAAMKNTAFAAAAARMAEPVAHGYTQVAAAIQGMHDAVDAGITDYSEMERRNTQVLTTYDQGAV